MACRAPGFLVSSSCFSFTAQLHSAQILWGLCLCCNRLCQSIQLFLVMVSVSLKETPMFTAGEHYVHLVTLDWYQDPSPRLRLGQSPSIFPATEWDQHRMSTLGYGVLHNQSNGHGSSSFLALVSRKLMLSALAPWPPWNYHACWFLVRILTRIYFIYVPHYWRPIFFLLDSPSSSGAGLHCLYRAHCCLPGCGVLSRWHCINNNRNSCRHFLPK